MDRSDSKVEKSVSKWTIKIWWIFVRRKFLNSALAGAAVGAIVAIKVFPISYSLLFQVPIAMMMGVSIIGFSLPLVFGTLSWLAADLSDTEDIIESAIQAAVMSDIGEEGDGDM